MKVSLGRSFQLPLLVSGQRKKKKAPPKKTPAQQVKSPGWLSEGGGGAAPASWRLRPSPRTSLRLARSLIAFLSLDKGFHEELFEGSLFHSTMQW